jgi:hypothetical protein
VTLDRLRRDLLILAAGLLGSLVLAFLIRRSGPTALVLPFAAVAVAVLLARPAMLGLLAVGACVIVEGTSGGLVTLGSTLYTQVKPHTVDPAELLLAAFAVSVALARLTSRTAMRPLGPLAWPLGLLGVAVVWGVVVAHGNGVGRSAITDNAHGFVVLLVVPFLVSWVLPGRHALRQAVLAGLGLALFKAVAGLASLVVGQGAADITAGSQLTYYEPAANWLMLVAVLAVLAAFAARLRLPRWARWGALLSLAAVILSYRRSFWLGGTVGIAATFVLATGPTGRRLLVPGALLAAGAIYLALSGGFVTDLQGPLAKRASSLKLSSVKSNPQDRYRLDERKNVLAELREEPVAGLGIGTPWRQRYPVSVPIESGSNYVHMSVLYYWLKLGILGPIAYLWTMAAAVVTGVGVFRRHPDPLVRAAAIAIACATLGLAVAELTASFVGVDFRLTVVFAAALGFLAAARRDARQEAFA